MEKLISIFTLNNYDFDIGIRFPLCRYFSGEFQLKANAVFYSSYYGRNKAVWAKVKAGAIIITAIYWAVMLLYTMLVLGILGVDGANCPIQSSMSGWKSIYNITNAQEYILIVLGGYLGCLFMQSLTMLVSAKTNSSVIAVIVPFILIFLPSFYQEQVYHY